jgi:hypothetical protein
MGPHGASALSQGGGLIAPGIVPLPPMGAFIPGAPMPQNQHQQQLQQQGMVISSPPPFVHQVSRLPSSAGGASGGAGAPGSVTGGGSLFGEWRAGVSVEERIGIRRKVREAYFRRCPTYESLLDTVTAVDEELLFACSAARIDYLKAAIDWDARIQVKRQQLTRPVAAMPTIVANGTGTGSADDTAAATDNGGLAGRKRAAEEFNSGNLPSTSILDGLSNVDLIGGAAAAAAPPAASSGAVLPGASLPLPPVSASLFPPPAAPLPAAAAASSSLADGDQPAGKKQRT